MPRFFVRSNHFKSHKLMKQKQLYTSPESEVMELKAEGVICASPDLTIAIGDPFSNTPDEVDW